MGGNEFEEKLDLLMSLLGVLKSSLFGSPGLCTESLIDRVRID